MKDAWLIARSRDSLPREVENLIRSEGYDLRWNDDLTAAASLAKGPESLLLIEDEFRDEDTQSFVVLIDRCRNRYVPCLLYSVSTGGGYLAHDAVGSPFGVIHEVLNLNEWHEKLTLYRQITRQAKELSQMQHRLVARTVEEDDDLRSAALIQQSLLPKKLPDIGGLRFAWEFEPFEKVGGDLFNVIQVDEETVMAFLLDVSGHGISSAMVTVSVNQSLSLHTGQLVKRMFNKPPYYRLLSPAEVMAELATEYPFDRFDKFFTIVYLLINIRTGEISYSCAGHPAPLLVRKNGESEWLATGGGLIGLLDTGPYEEAEIKLEKGDRLFLYSDGLPEYSDYHSEHFGTRRLVKALSRDGRSLQGCCESVLTELKEFGENRPLQDDVSLLGIEFLGNGGG